MKIKSILNFLYFSIILSNSLIAQEKYDYQWIAGYPTVPDSAYGVYKMDFNEDTLNFIKIENASLKTVISVASICDKNGKLILYSNGCQIHNGDFELVEGCENVNPGKTWNSYCQPEYFASYPTIQSQLFLPIPEKDGQFIYLTHKIEHSEKYNYIDFNYNRVL